MRNKPRLFAVLLKAAVLFVLFNFAFVFFKNVPLGKLTLYNSLVPGRERFPFGETRQAYNLSLFDLDAMFAAHIITGAEKIPNEYRVLLIGDSSVWGTLLTPGQTFAGQLNTHSSPACGKAVRVYNLGYPTIALMKDLMILDQAKTYQPDLIIWLTTLEAFPKDKQFSSPIVANNATRIQSLITMYHLLANPSDPALNRSSTWEQTFVSQRRNIADIIRLQMDGILWAATGIDQYYPKEYEHAQIDLAADKTFHGLAPGTSLTDALLWDVLDAGMSMKTPILLVNEPILISHGHNSDIRYNFFYPRWAYDEYRALLGERALKNHWHYVDLWDLVPMQEFTNSAVHMTPRGESLLAARIADEITMTCQ